MSGIVSGFAVADSVGLLARRYIAAWSSRPEEIRTVTHAEFLPPYSRAAATVLHRLPGTESAVIVAERCAFRLVRDAAMLRVNELAERPKWRAPRMLYTNFSNSISTSPAAFFEATLRAVLATAGTQIHARPSCGTKFDVQRRVKHLLQ